MVPVASLRVFQPLDALPAPERARWERFVEEGEHLRPYRPVYRHRWSSGALGVISADDDRADVRLVGGRWYVCPWRTRLRLLASVLSLRESVPPEVADGFVPEAEAKRAAKELARIRRQDPGAVPTLLESAWHVPIRWFALFDDEERRIERVVADSYRLRYWTDVPLARERAARARTILREHQLAMVAELVDDMAAWLSVFDDGARLELDYGDVAALFDPIDLDEDHSALDLAGSLDALERGDLDAAAEGYQRVAARWTDIKTRGSLN